MIFAPLFILILFILPGIVFGFFCYKFLLIKQADDPTMKPGAAWRQKTILVFWLSLLAAIICGLATGMILLQMVSLFVPQDI